MSTEEEVKKEEVLNPKTEKNTITYSSGYKVLFFFLFWVVFVILIEINEQDIYLCYKDKPFCEGTIEKIGERRLATYKYESTLHCALRLGGGCNWITPSNVGSFLGIYNLDNKINNKGK